MNTLISLVVGQFNGFPEYEEDEGELKEDDCDDQSPVHSESKDGDSPRVTLQICDCMQMVFSQYNK